MASKKLPDTTIQIAEYGYSWQRGKELKSIDSKYGISVKYIFPAQSFTQTMVQYGHDTILILYTDDVYKDWWGMQNGLYSEVERTIIDVGTNQVSTSVYLPMIDDAYFYLKETGQILYAGKNSPYYGYTNINDMP